MKYIKSILTINWVIAVIISLSGCNVKEVLTDPNGQNKSFILLNPNFLTTNYQVRLLDTANMFIEKQMIVEVVSNKKIVDQEGYYKNTFTVTNGLLNFAVDPNELITETDPIYLNMIIYSSDPASISPKTIKYVGKNSFDRVFKVELKNIVANNLVSEVPSVKASATNASAIKSAATSSLSNELLKLGGIEYPIYQYGDNFFASPSPYGSEKYWYISNYTHSADYYNSDLLNLNTTRLERDLPIQLSYRDLVDLNTMDYSYDVYFKDINGISNRFTVNRDGSSELFVNRIITKKAAPSNWSGIAMIPKESSIIAISTYSMRTNTELKNCGTGFNFKITNIAKGANPELEYITYRNDQSSGKYYITNAGIAKASEQYPTYNTGELLYSNIKNKVVFKENSQYRIVPSTFELTGTAACGSTTNVDIVPKDNVVYYKLAVESQCSAENYGAVANANLMFRKKGTTAWEGLSIKNGLGSLYLENNAVYEVTGSFGNKKVNFNFTNDPSLFETQKQESLSKNKDLTNVIYNLSTDASNTKLLNIKLFIQQNACPFN